jgi:hypothetical protein
MSTTGRDAGGGSSVTADEITPEWIRNRYARAMAGEVDPAKQSFKTTPLMREELLERVIAWAAEEEHAVLNTTKSARQSHWPRMCVPRQCRTDRRPGLIRLRSDQEEYPEWLLRMYEKMKVGPLRSDGDPPCETRSASERIDDFEQPDGGRDEVEERVKEWIRERLRSIMRVAEDRN